MPFAIEAGTDSQSSKFPTKLSMYVRHSALILLCLLGLPAVSAKSSKEESDHRKDCRFKSDGAYDRYNVSCAPAAKVPKPKPVKKQVADDLKKK